MTKVKIENIAESLISIYPLLYKGISKPMRTLTSITPAGMFVLGNLRREGGLSMSEIGKRLVMPRPHVTVIINRLIREGYVTRQTDLQDRRIIHILITEKGLSDFAAIKFAVGETLKDKLLLLSTEELKILSVASKQVKELLQSIVSKE